MQYLTKNESALRKGAPNEYDIEERECKECGDAAYYFNDPAQFDDGPTRCESCHKESLKEWITDGDHNTADALDRLRSHGYLPVRDPRDGLFITKVETEKIPGSSRSVKHMTKIVERDCPVCGYDRADKTNWAVYTYESGHHVTCRACDHVIEERSSL